MEAFRQSILMQDQQSRAGHISPSREVRIFPRDALDELAQSEQNAGKPSSSASQLKAHVTTKGWTLESILAKSDNFVAVPRRQYTARPHEVHKHVVDNGEPLILEGLDESSKWDKKLLSAKWLSNSLGNEVLHIRNVRTYEDKDTSIFNYLDECRRAMPHISSLDEDRWYGKDMNCPKEWADWLKLKGCVPPSYLPEGTDDLFSNFASKHVPENLMCYLGFGDTYTPAHKDLCGSVGHNLMCYAENGSAYWFMTKTSDAPKASQYFTEELKHELDLEHHTLSIEELANAPVNIYIAEQKVGDLVLVPPRCVHQVVNNGGITIKTSWSRMTVRSLEIALRQELDIYRQVCRKEVYRCKLLTLCTVRQLTKSLLETKSCDMEEDMGPTDKSIQLVDDMKTTLDLYERILIEEWSPEHSKMDPAHGSLWGTDDAGWEDENTLGGELAPVCDFCGCDIFQSYFICDHKWCSSTKAFHGKVDLCAGCYVEGRSCGCKMMKPVQLREFDRLLGVRDEAVKALQLHEEWREKAGERRWLQREEHPAHFRGALKLRDIRLQWREKYLKTDKEKTISALTRACRNRVGVESHQVPIDSWIKCDPCHSGMCFLHLVTKGVASWQALLASNLHSLHSKESQDRITMARQKAMSGKFGDRILMLTCVLDHSYGSQSLPRALRSGFYDNPEYKLPDWKGSEYTCGSFSLTIPPRPRRAKPLALEDIPKVPGPRLGKPTVEIRIPAGFDRESYQALPESVYAVGSPVRHKRKLPIVSSEDESSLQLESEADSTDEESETSDDDAPLRRVLPLHPHKKRTSAAPLSHQPKRAMKNGASKPSANGHHRDRVPSSSRHFVSSSTQPSHPSKRIKFSGPGPSRPSERDAPSSKPKPNGPLKLKIPGLANPVTEEMAKKLIPAKSKPDYLTKGGSDSRPFASLSFKKTKGINQEEAALPSLSNGYSSLSLRSPFHPTPTPEDASLGNASPSRPGGDEATAPLSELSPLTPTTPTPTKALKRKVSDHREPLASPKCSQPRLPEVVDELPPADSYDMQVDVEPQPILTAGTSASSSSTVFELTAPAVAENIEPEEAFRAPLISEASKTGSLKRVSSKRRPPSTAPDPFAEVDPTTGDTLGDRNYLRLHTRLGGVESTLKRELDKREAERDNIRTFEEKYLQQVAKNRELETKCLRLETEQLDIKRQLAMLLKERDERLAMAQTNGRPGNVPLPSPEDREIYYTPNSHLPEDPSARSAPSAPRSDRERDGTSAYFHNSNSNGHSHHGYQNGHITPTPSRPPNTHNHAAWPSNRGQGENDRGRGTPRGPRGHVPGGPRTDAGARFMNNNTDSGWPTNRGTNTSRGNNDQGQSKTPSWPRGNFHHSSQYNSRGDYHQHSGQISPRKGDYYRPGGEEYERRFASWKEESRSDVDDRARREDSNRSGARDSDSSESEKVEQMESGRHRAETVEAIPHEALRYPSGAEDDPMDAIVPLVPATGADQDEVIMKGDQTIIDEGEVDKAVHIESEDNELGAPILDESTRSPGKRDTPRRIKAT